MQSPRIRRAGQLSAIALTATLTTLSADASMVVHSFLIDFQSSANNQGTPTGLPYYNVLEDNSALESPNDIDGNPVFGPVLGVLGAMSDIGLSMSSTPSTAPPEAINDASSVALHRHAFSTRKLKSKTA